MPQFYLARSGTTKDVPLYPTQALFALTGLLVFTVVWVRRKKKRFEGEIALAGACLFSLLAFGIEFLRGDLRVLYEIGGVILSQNQILGINAFAAAAILYFYRRRENRKSPANLPS